MRARHLVQRQLRRRGLHVLGWEPEHLRAALRAAQGHAECDGGPRMGDTAFGRAGATAVLQEWTAARTAAVRSGPQGAWQGGG